MIPIVYTKWGVANRFNDCIELNEKLKGYPKLHKQLLQHEIKHSDKKFTMNDLKHDVLSHEGIDYRQLIQFMIKNPRTITQILPFYWSRKRKKVIYDLNLMLIYSAFIGMVSVVIFLGWKFL